MVRAMNHAELGLQPDWSGNGCRALFTRRAGGVSAATYASLNLGFHVGDADAATAENLRRLAAFLSVAPEQVCFATQVHGIELIDVTGPVPGGRAGLCDGLATATPGVALMVRTADCLPLLLFDPQRRAVAAMHAGRRGTLADAAGAAVRHLVQRYGCAPRTLQAAIGPAAGRCCYAVNAAAVAELRAARPADAAQFIGRAPDGQPTLDLAGINRAQLLAAGVPADRIELSPDCTICNRAYFSYRRDGVTGRQAAVIMLTG